MKICLMSFVELRLLYIPNVFVLSAFLINWFFCNDSEPIDFFGQIMGLLNFPQANKELVHLGVIEG